MFYSIIISIQLTNVRNIEISVCRVKCLLIHFLETECRQMLMDKLPVTVVDHFNQLLIKKLLSGHLMEDRV